jgi:hypothetical protein
LVDGRFGVNGNGGGVENGASQRDRGDRAEKDRARSGTTK